jgi:hypothetical protein
MTPWQIARTWQLENSTESFEEIFNNHLHGGLIYSTPDVFLLARECCYDPTTNEIIMDTSLPPNAWFVELAASVGHANPVREFLRVATRPLEWALWCRHNSYRLHAYKWTALAKKVRLA